MAFATLLGLIGPVFAVILVGALLSRFSRFGDATAATLDDLVYYLALPGADLRFRRDAQYPGPGTARARPSSC